MKLFKSLTLGLSILLPVVSCSSSEEAPPPEASEPIEEISEEVEEPTTAEAVTFDASPIHFGYDQFDLDEGAKALIEAKAIYLRDNPEISIQIEGHADERGSNAYNLALSEKRAQNTKDYLISLGVTDSQVSTIAYGEEKPVNEEKTEAAWHENRRAEFVPAQ